VHRVGYYTYSHQWFRCKVVGITVLCIINEKFVLYSYTMQFEVSIGLIYNSDVNKPQFLLDYKETGQTDNCT
jgi:hypothetical protein